jgi:hypothetical protein
MGLILRHCGIVSYTYARAYKQLMMNISNNSSFRQKHPGVPDGSDGSDGMLYPLTENYTLPVAFPSISKMCFSHWMPQGVSERTWSVNLDASISGEYETIGGHSCRPSEKLGAPAISLGALTTSLGAPRITVMYSVCILNDVSMHLYSNPSTHAVSGLAAGGASEQFEVRLKMTIQ